MEGEGEADRKEESAEPRGVPSSTCDVLRVDPLGLDFRYEPPKIICIILLCEALFNYT